MIRLVVVGMDLQANELLLNCQGKLIRFKPRVPVFYYRLGEIIRIKGGGK